MKAILVNEDQSLRWAEVEDPVMGEEDCLIKIEAAGVNRADLMQREGNYPPPEGCPQWMGLEIAGEIVDMGPKAKESSCFQIGDKVCALLGGGGYAQFVSVKYDMLLPIPKNFSVTEAAALPEAFATAYLNLFYEGKAKEGDTLLVTGGNSGLASVIIPMAKAYGIRVVTTVRGKEKAKAIEHLGADRIVDTKEEDIVAVLKEQYKLGHPVDICIDCLGGEIMGKCLRYLNHGARWIMIAALAGAMTEVDLRGVFVRNVRIIGSTLRSRKPEFKAALLKELTQKVWPKIESGEISPTVCATFPIEEAEKAHDLLFGSKSTGKVILTVS